MVAIFACLIYCTLSLLKSQERVKHGKSNPGLCEFEFNKSKWPFLKADKIKMLHKFKFFWLFLSGVSNYDIKKQKFKWLYFLCSKTKVLMRIRLPVWRWQMSTSYILKNFNEVCFSSTRQKRMNSIPVFCVDRLLYCLKSAYSDI